MLNVYTPMSWTHGYSYYLIATIEVNKNSSPPSVSLIGLEVLSLSHHYVL